MHLLFSFNEHQQMANILSSVTAPTRFTLDYIKVHWTYYIIPSLNILINNSTI